MALADVRGRPEPEPRVTLESACPRPRLASGWALGPVAVDVECEVEDTLQWLESFFTPAVDLSPFGAGEVVIHHGSVEFDALDRKAPAADRVIPCFALDRKLLAFPAWTDGDVSVLADRDRSCFYRIGHSHVDVAGRPGVLRTRQGLMRVVREVLTTRWLARGGVLDLHAAAFEADGNAVVIAGPKYAGKTTMLCHALASGRARLIANDRVFVDLGAEPPEVRGIPTIVAVRRDTRRLFPALEEGVSMSPSGLASALGAACVPSAPLTSIVFPEIAGDVPTCSVSTISKTEGLERLRACTYGRHRDAGIRTVFEEMAAALRTEQVTTTVESLADGTRFFRGRLGAEAYGGSADGWIDALVSGL